MEQQWVVWAGYVDGKWQEVVSPQAPREARGLDRAGLVRLHAVHRAAWDFHREQGGRAAPGSSVSPMMEMEGLVELLAALEDGRADASPAAAVASAAGGAGCGAYSGRKPMIHYLDGASMFPYFPHIPVATCCLLVESDDGLVLVDTGFGTRDYMAPTRLTDNFLKLMRSERRIEGTLLHQVQQLGYTAGDVRHIVMTHLHLDHAGGLPDFPEAAVHVFRPEYEAAMRPRGPLGPFFVSAQWAHGPRWVLHEEIAESWYGFDAIPLEGLAPRILLLPLPGHTPGHCGVAVEVEGGWFLHCGDALPYGGVQPPAWLTRALLGPHEARLRALALEHAGTVRMTSAHLPPADLAALKDLF